ncbi:MAG: vitamin B12 dependent methionine synthase, partial [Firmicutes bacterium]|nr:vitamin B12 dependent methionine synthase [Bacillota bacterium]
IGGVDEIGVSLNDAGYIKPWNSGSHIHFPGDGYHNCSLCRKYDCIGRRAPFNREEYIRIFGTEP